MSAPSEEIRARGGLLYPPTVAPPGSDRAFADGCTCPPDDNYSGRYLPREGWVLDLDCTLHTGDVQWSAPRGVVPPAQQATLARRRRRLEAGAA